MHRDDYPLSYTCDQRWDELDPRGRDKRCADCSLKVFDLSVRTQAEADALFRRAATERICVRRVTTPSGEIVHRTHRALPGAHLIRRFTAPAVLVATLVGRPGCEAGETVVAHRVDPPRQEPSPNPRPAPEPIPEPAPAPTPDPAPRDAPQRKVIVLETLGIALGQPNEPKTVLFFGLDESAWDIPAPGDDGP